MYSTLEVFGGDFGTAGMSQPLPIPGQCASNVDLLSIHFLGCRQEGEQG